MKKILVAGICVLFVVSAALADWNPGDPVKWSHVQLPNISSTGMDVMNGNLPHIVGGPSEKKVLADDFECTTRGLITDIHIWGSWKGDVLPEDTSGLLQYPGAMVFHMKIWSDIPDPDDQGPEFSMPGEILWEYDVGPEAFSVREYGDPTAEDWFDPNIPEWLDDNHQRAFQYNFFIDRDHAFMQEGTADEPKVYWLSIDVMPRPGPNQVEEPVFGWKTTHRDNNWNDDATFADWVWDSQAGEWIPGQWNEMVYPFGHEFETESINLAFVITPEPTTLVLLGMGSPALIRRRRR